MRLKELRKQRKLKQIDVAEVLNCSQGVYSRYESSEREPPFDIIKKLADFYGVTVDYLMGVDTEQTDTSTPAKTETAPANKAEGEENYSVVFRSNVGNMYSRLNSKDKELIDEMVRTLFEKTFGQ